jgi:hypothetical protein
MWNKFAAPSIISSEAVAAAELLMAANGVIDEAQIDKFASEIQNCLDEFMQHLGD